MGVSANRSSTVEKSLRWVNIRLSRARGERDTCVLDDPLGAFIARVRTMPPAGSSHAQWRCLLAAMAFGFYCLQRCAVCASETEDLASTTGFRCPSSVRAESIGAPRVCACTHDRTYGASLFNHTLSYINVFMRHRLPRAACDFCPRGF